MPGKATMDSGTWRPFDPVDDDHLIRPVTIRAAHERDDAVGCVRLISVFVVSVKPQAEPGAARRDRRVSDASAGRSVIFR